MADPSPQKIHCEAFLAANADGEIHKPPHAFNRPPIADPAGWFPPDVTAVARRLTVSLTTHQSSFDVWAALARFDTLLSDYRRLAPRFSFEQLSGQPSVAAGNEYRRTLRDPSALDSIEAACSDLSGEERRGALNGARTMDIRINRAGPWGGETGELVVEALFNHAMAGMASLWILVHSTGADGPMRVRLDVFEVARWAWGPDYLSARAGQSGRSGDGILDWSYMFERLAETLDAAPETSAENETFHMIAPPAELAEENRVQEALAVHPALAVILE